jgi:hypothetical protein
MKLGSVAENGAFVGMAAVYGNKDRHGDIIEPGAFTKTVQENPEIPILFQHTEPIGKGIVQDLADGLKVEGELLVNDVVRAREAYALVKSGAVKGLSVRLSIVKDAWDSVKKARRILEAKLYEISLVAVPANPAAEITGVKSIDSVKEFFTELNSQPLTGEQIAVLKDAHKRLTALLEKEAAMDTIEPEQLHSMISDWRALRC